MYLDLVDIHLPYESMNSKKYEILSSEYVCGSITLQDISNDEIRAQDQYGSSIQDNNLRKKQLDDDNGGDNHF